MHFHFIVAGKAGQTTLKDGEKGNFDSRSKLCPSTIESRLLDVTWRLPLTNQWLPPSWPNLSMDPPITAQSSSQLSLTSLDQQHRRQMAVNQIVKSLPIILWTWGVESC